MMINENSKVIAVDFDGTIVEHAYPRIGEEMLFAIATLKKLQAKGHKLLLWTIREGELLDEAVAFCREQGLEFYAVNRNYPEEAFEFGVTPRKLNADIFIDDRNVGGFRGWGEIYQMLHPEDGDFKHDLINKAAHQNYKTKKKRKKGLLQRLFGQ